MSGEKFTNDMDQIFRILYAGCFPGRVHGQHGEADIHGRHGNFRTGNISKGGTAGVIAAVRKNLCGNIEFPAEVFEISCREGIGGIALAGGVFYDDASIDDGLIDRVRIFRMVRVNAVGIVCGNHKGPGHHGHGLIVRIS